MSTLSKEVAAQIDQAFDFRGHVTVTFPHSKVVQGYPFNPEPRHVKGRA